jgi:uncharacterized membrane protein YecN with MAPEG domain
MIMLPVSLLTAAAAILLNLWLGWRIAAFREQYKVSVGDGGQEPLLRRMRAQANFIENAPFFLLLLAGLELAGANAMALGIIAAVFVAARAAHAIGMDGGPQHRWRVYGIAGSQLASLALAVWAIICAGGVLLGR